MTIDAQARYSKTHEWVRKEGALFVYGITDHAQAELSDIVYVDLPDVGDAVKQGDAVGVVESVKAASDLIIPVSGEVVEVNEALTGSPELMNSSPYQDGWILKLKPADLAEWDALLTPEAYTQLLGE